MEARIFKATKFLLAAFSERRNNCTSDLANTRTGLYMKLEAAAAVLGVAVDADPETLKAAYRRLALRWHPDKCKDPDAKERFQEVSVAYTRLVSGDSGRDHDGEGGDRFDDDVDEMRAFMSRFMELVGMFGSDVPNIPNGCGPGCKGGHVHVPPGMPPNMANMPSASVAFSMVFGERPTDESWSSEEEEDSGEGVEEDYDPDEEDFDLDQDGELIEGDDRGQHHQHSRRNSNINGSSPPPGSSAAAAAAAAAAATAAAEVFKAGIGACASEGRGVGGVADGGIGASGEGSWEPMVRHYLHMNLKEEVEQQRVAGRGGGMSVGSSESVDLEEEASRQTKALKKRQDKKRRQKDKKHRESVAKQQVQAQEAADRSRDDAAAAYQEQMTEEELLAAKRRENVRLKRKAEEDRRIGLFTACRAGLIEEVRRTLGTGLVRITERERENGRSGASLLHACVTDFSGRGDGAPELRDLAADRLSIAAMILESKDPAVDAGAVDSAGLTVLHRVTQALDLAYLALLLEERQTSQERRDQILLNERCLLKGWTPLHYAAAEGSPCCVTTLLAAGASVNIHGAVIAGIDCNGGSTGSSNGDGVDGAGTALQLTRALLSKEGPGARKKGLQEVARLLSAAAAALERAKEQRERKEREAKLAKKRSEAQKEKKKDAKEKELLSRKQRQLKDKQERQEREERQEEERRGRKEENTKVEGKSKKAKKKKNRTGCDDDDNVGSGGGGGASSAGDGDDGGDGVSSGNSAEGDGGSLKNSDSPPRSPAGTTGGDGGGGGVAGASGTAPAASVSAHESLMSRDDLLAQLITMGFKEEHVHRGTSCVGFDLNALLSWLCEHPDGGGSTPAEQASAFAGKAAMNARRNKGNRTDCKSSTKVDAGKGNSGTVLSAALRNHGPLGVGGPGTWGGISAAGVGLVAGLGKDGAGPVSAGVAGSMAAAAAKAAEKRRHNLELRRINRAWNASLPQRRAEEEEKKAAETTREKEVEDAKEEKRRQMDANRVTIPAAAATRQPAALQQHPSPGGGNKPTMHMSPNHNNPFPILCGGLAGPGGAGGIGPASNKAIVRGAAGSPAPVPSNVVSPGMRPVGAVGSTPPRGVGVVINGNGSVGEGVSGVRAGAGNGMAENINVKSSAAMNANSRNNGRATKALGSSAIAGSAGGGGGGGNGESGGVANKVQQEQQQHYHHQNQHQPSSSNNVASLAHLSQHRNAPGNYRRGGGNGEGPPGGGVRAGGGGSGPLQQHHQHQLHKGSGGNGGALSYGVGGSGVSNGGGGGALGGAGGVGVGRPGPGAFAPGVGRGHMGPMPPFGAHGPHPAPPPGAPAGMPMSVPPHLGHMQLAGQSMAYPGFRHSHGGPPSAHGPLHNPRPPRGPPPPHVYGTGGAMSPVGMPGQQPQGPHAEWIARQRAAPAGWGNNPAGVPMPGPHSLQHHPRGPPNAQPMPHPWGEGWGVGPPPGALGSREGASGSPREIPHGVGAGAAAAAAAAATATILHQQQQRDIGMLQQQQQQQRQRRHQEQQHLQQGQRHQRQEILSSAAAAPAASPIASSSPTLVSSPAHASNTTPSTKPPSMSSSTSLPDSPSSATDISSALANGELSAAARVFIPTSLSPAKPPTPSTSGGTPGARRPDAGGGGATPTTPSASNTSMSAAVAGLTPPRAPVAGGGGLRSLPSKSVVGGGLFGSSWGVGVVNGNSATSVLAGGNNVSASGVPNLIRGGGSGDTMESSSLWGTVGLVGGGGGAQAIWGRSSLLDSTLTGNGGGERDELSLLLPPSVVGPSVVPLATGASGDSFGMSWSIAALPRNGTDGNGDGGGEGARGDLAGDDFASRLASLGVLQLDDPDHARVGGGDKASQQRDLFGTADDTGSRPGGGLGWG